MKLIKNNIIILLIITLTIGAIIYTHYNLNKEPTPIDWNYINNAPQCLININTYHIEEIEQFINQCQEKDNKTEHHQKKNYKAEEKADKVKPSYTEEDLYWLSKVIAQELGANWVPDYYQQCVGSVVLNRVNDSRFPNTIYGVLHQPGQYCGFYAEPTTQNIANAKYLLENGSVLPENVVFQALFVQGSGTYCSYYDPAFNNTTYFCY